MTKQMRIVGMNSDKRKDEPYAVFIQMRSARGNYTGEWEQEALSEYEFSILMQNKFPNFYKEYESNKIVGDVPVFVYFYNYGETDDMKRKGQSYIFTSDLFTA